MLWVVLFFVSSIAIQGEGVYRSDSVAEIRDYFSDDGDAYLLGDYLIGLGFILGFLPFLAALTTLIGRTDGTSAMLGRLVTIAGVLTVAGGLAAAIPTGALAVGAAENPEVDDSSIRTLMELDAYGFASLSLAVGAFALSAGVAIWWSRALTWWWVSILAIIGGILAVISGAWPIDGDEEGFIGSLGFIGLPVIALFILLASINMIMGGGRADEVVVDKTA